MACKMTEERDPNRKQTIRGRKKDQCDNSGEIKTAKVRKLPKRPSSEAYIEATRQSERRTQQ